MNQVRVNCQVCGGANDREFRDLGEYRLAQCVDCGHIYINPRPDPQSLVRLYEEALMYFRGDYEPLALELPVLQGVLHDLKKVVPSGRLLEVGCGRGELLVLARQRGYEVEGCDLQRSPALANELRVHLGELREIDLAPGSFDCIVMRNVVEHLFDPGDELRLCHRLLKPGGCVYIKVPNADYHYGLKWILTQKPHLFDPPWHLNYFTQDGLTRFLRNNGFDVVSWLVEQPTPDPRFLHNVARKGSYLILEAMRRITDGAYFPKPLLTCIARKRTRPATTVANPAGRELALAGASLQ